MNSRVTFSTAGTDPLISDLENMGEALTNEFLERVQELSPVDTGDYRSGWKADIDAEFSVIYNTDEPIEKLIALENGWSNQAASGVIGPAVSEFPYMVEQYVRKTS